jgi:hypothetical protein
MLGSKEGPIIVMAGMPEDMPAFFFALDAEDALC